MRKLLFVAFIATALWFGLDDWRQRSIDHPPGVLVATVPLQRDTAGAVAFEHAGRTLTPRADFEVTARVLAAERYRFDRLARLMPRDLALGWGVMSDSAVLDQLTISQSGRFYFWRTNTATPPVPLELIIASSANMHLIPADRSVAAVIDRVRVGQVVTLQGRLVDVREPGGMLLKTSMTRDDSGAGACEVIFVERAYVR
jgi:hypothetical protein